MSSPVLFALLAFAGLVLGFYRIRRLGVLIWFSVPEFALLVPWLSFAIEANTLPFLSSTSAAGLAPTDFFQEPLWFATLLVVAILALAGGVLRPAIGLPLWLFSLMLLFASSYQPITGSHALQVAILISLVLIAIAAADQLGSKTLIAVTSLFGILASTSLVLSFQQEQSFEYVQDRQVPALVMAASDVDSSTRTLSISQTTDGFAAELVWGDGRNQEETALTYRYLKPESALEPQLAQLAASLVAGNPDGVQALLDATGVDFILLAPDVDPGVQIALDSLTLLQPSGQTSFGLLWRVVETNQAPAVAPELYGQRDLQLGILAAFLLLAIPTPGSITGRRLRRSA